MPENENATPDTDWKARYQAALNESDAREAELQSEAATLRRALVRVCAAAASDGKGKALDGLRAAIKREAGIDEIEQHARAIADSLLRDRRSAEPATRGDRDAENPPVELLEILERRAANRELRTRARALLRDAERGEVGAAWQSALELVAEAARTRPARGGLLGRLRRTSPPDAPAAPQDPQTVPETVRTPLVWLIDKLVRIEEADNTAKRLKRRLDSELPMDELPATVESVTELVVNASQEEMAALQAFLQQLTGRLFDMHGFLDDSEADVAGEREESAALDHVIRREIAGMQHSVANAPDLPSLRQAVSGQLDSIARHMDEYRRNQAQRQRAAELRMSELTRRLEETEQQADRLRRRLLQQQARAEVDGLTQLANRQAYEQRLEYEYARWRRYGSPLSLAVLDLDRFKSINDRFGHNAGDKVLRTAARVLRSNIRETDFLARYGGEEFTLVMPETNLDQGRKTAEKLRAALAAAPFHDGDQRLPVTLSAGVAEFNEADTRESAFERADRALYNAKNAGRNRVEHHPGADTEA